MMTALPHPSAQASPHPWPPHVAPWPIARPVGHLVCDLHGHVCWADDLAAAVLADAQVVLLQGDGRLGVRSHRLGLLALRNAMRLAVVGTPAEPLTLRHGPHALQVGVHALPDDADGMPRVLLSLCSLDPGGAPTTPRTVWRT